MDSTRRKVRAAVTNEILGEIIRVLIAKAENEELLESMLVRLAKELNDFTFLESVYNIPEFMEILTSLSQDAKLRCGYTDRIHIAMAAYHQIKFFTFDEKIKGDKTTINSLLLEYDRQLRLYPQ